ncbi:undecaprenyl/decaprenyl-phosphate alpha-N-acetylglucosaminyl 1-phosphate transferase [bacterium]|nr:undecaprenyl/decaprenyl-phosphate alpha-N-acetylglucosaminyl 1-phosphate transferase [bacterium]
MENIVLQSISTFISTTLLTGLLIHIYIVLSKKIGLVDQPGNRKIHQQSTPLVGGLAIFTAFTIVAFFHSSLLLTILIYQQSFIALALIFLMSIYDDRFDLSAKLRLLIQIAAAFLVTHSGVRIESMFGLFGIHEIPLAIQYIITILVLVGSTNAFNLIDGIDGLAGSIGLVTTLLLAGIALSLNQQRIFIVCLTLSATLIAFLKFNLYPAKIFMGDAGSMTLGFLLTTLSIILLQAAMQHTNSQSIFILIASGLLVPVIDALRVFLKRFSKGYSILAADKSHLHHLLLTNKKNHAKIVFSIVALQLALMLIGIILSAIISSTLVILSLILIQVVLSKWLMINQTLAEWQIQLQQNEKVLNS